MKALSGMALVEMAIAAIIFTTRAVAQQPMQQPAAAAQREIIVSLEDHKLALVENGEVKKVYPVAVGKPSTPSPEGTFTIERRVKNPTYHHDGKTVLPGPNNPVGTRWMGLSKSGYGIHGTNDQKSIGKSASHGCIRMAKKDLEEFYELVAVGDTVRLIGHRDDETARLFGPAEIAAPAAPPMLTATTDTTPVAPAASEPAPFAPAAPVASMEMR